MREIFRAAAELQEFCEQQGWQFCFIGGVALLRWGEPRETVDADLTLLADWGQEGPYIDALLARFEGRIAQARDFALHNRVLLLRSETGVGLDIAFGALPFETEAVRRSSRFTYPGGHALRTCTAEDLIVMKAFANRGQDWVDVERVIQRQARLDWLLIWQNLTPLAELKEAPEILPRLRELQKPNPEPTC
jgi:hypothetical protein